MKKLLYVLTLGIMLVSCSKEQEKKGQFDHDKKSSMGAVSIEWVNYRCPELFPVPGTEIMYECQTPFAEEGNIRIAIKIDSWGAPAGSPNKYKYDYYLWRRPVGSTGNYSEYFYRVCGCEGLQYPCAQNMSQAVIPYLYFEVPATSSGVQYEYHISYGLNGGGQALNPVHFTIGC